MEKKLLVYTDGGARGNPGPAAIGIYVLDEDGKEIFKLGKKIGEATNNVAEYKAVIFALEMINKDENIKIKSIDFFIDSLLIVNQLNGYFKIKDGKLRELLFVVRQLEQKTKKNIFYHHIPREKNFIADSLVNSSLSA